MSFKSVVKKVAKAGLSPSAIVGGAFGAPGFGLLRGVIRDERKERIEEQQAAEQREKAILGEQMLAEEEERRRKKMGALGQKTTGLASLIGSGGNTLG